MKQIILVSLMLARALLTKPVGLQESLGLRKEKVLCNSKNNSILSGKPPAPIQGEKKKPN